MFEKFVSGNFKLLQNAVENSENLSVFGLNIGEKLALVEDSAFLFYVVEDLDKANIVYNKLSAMGRKCQILSKSISIFSSEFEDCQSILNTLYGIIDGELDSIIITPEVLASVYPKKFKLQKIELKVNDEIDVTSFAKKLNDLNLKRVDLVSNPNEYSIRGDIIDVYPSEYKPVRIFVDYDKVETIKEYNSITMLTTNSIDSLIINANSYVLLNLDDIKEFYETNKIKFDGLYDDFMCAKSNDYRLMAFGRNNYASIFDYVNDGTIVFDGAKVIYDKLVEYIEDFNTKIKEQKFPLNVIFKSWEIKLSSALDFGQKTLIAHHYISQSNRLFKPQKVFSIRTIPPMNYVNYKDGLKLDVDNFYSQNYTIILCIGAQENLPKFSQIFDKENKQYYVTHSMSLCNKNALNLLTKEYPLDIILPDEKLAIISSDSLLGQKKKVENIKIDFFDGELPQKDDYVVHDIHGIGKCLGVETLKISNTPRDYVVIEYKNNDKLYLPVENMDQISKYLGSDKAPNLNKIGGVEFAKTKQKVKSAVKKIAYDLVALYRERQNKKGYKYLPDDELQQKFESSFDHTETVDQLKAINDCKKDMENGKIMDRLVCGDVGFGKTEVALRIAFKTILNGKQVAFLCPTTILSEQHYATCQKRMFEFGIKVEVINRLKTPSEISRIKKDLASQKIDIIIGTHKLLGNEIEFKDLGLLILDEEQKFGVADKDKIKNIKKQINVLTLSATPIPRTLNMSLIGVRDISVIETPPVERITSDVQVVEYSDEIIKKAINLELGRRGQVLVIYNRVETIYKFASYLKTLVPDAIINVAHGQMTDTELEQEIFKLYSGATQVLVATTLIENGVDLPNANTLIVINSDLLGLSQLYQLKGRIGRSDKNSFAYFTFDNRKLLTENAYKRLQAIKEFSGMGSGFKIAMRDLEIRGAGSLLGLEQSGHIEKIGYNMYVQLLSDSVKEINNENVKSKTDVRVETNLPAYLSTRYAPSSQARMKMYRDIAYIDSSEKYVEFIKNTENVFGQIPEELLNLIKIGYIKNLCGYLNVNKVIIKEKSSIIFESKEAINQDVLGSIEQFKQNVALSFVNLPTIEINNISIDEILDFLISYLQFVVCK